MKIEQRRRNNAGEWYPIAGTLAGARPDFALVCGGRFQLGDPAIVAELRALYPGARLVLASSAGEICNTTVSIEELVVTAVAFARSSVACAATSVRSQFESRAKGRELAGRLLGPGLVHVFVISDGQLVNGTELTSGLHEILPQGVTLTGGLAGDGARFEQTLVGLDERPVSGRIVAVGFYGRELQVGCGSSGGWVPVGEVRTATRTSGNILFALDDQPALRLYKEHLGPDAESLPESALRFPLCVTAAHQCSVVRTILSVEEVTQSIVFAGDVPEGSRVRFMQASHEALIGGARQAAMDARLALASELTLCVSCVGRRLVLGERAAEEVQGVREAVGPESMIAGFYSYGELAPDAGGGFSQLHNQTMTITTLREA